METNDQFLRLLLRYEADVRAFIGSIVIEHHAREDVFQEVVLTLWRKFDTYDSRHSFGAWARGIAINKVLKEREKNSRFPVRFSPATLQAVADAFTRTEEQASCKIDALERCVKILPARDQDLLALRYREGMKPPEIANRTGQSIGAVYQALTRIRARLQACIQQRVLLETRG